MKLYEIEGLLEKGKVTADNISAFKISLKRTPKSYRCEHCYTTAASFPKKYWKEAITLIQYGLQEFEASWVDQMRSYENMAIIYETVSDYPNALCAYQNALDSVAVENRHSYEPTLSADLLRVELHCSQFAYTDALFHYYEQSMKQDEFPRSFAHRLFYQAVAEMVTHSHNGESEQAAHACDRAKHILSPTFAGPLKLLLLRNKYVDSAKATKEAVQYLRSFNKI